ncbi:MAG: EpsD family peptidyl-prolyl cis-trans isomerase [Rhodoferax sp.]
MTASSTRFTLTLLAAALALSLSACGKKDEKKMVSQVAAKVDSEEISVQQINQVLSQTNTSGTTPEATQAINREVLEKLIDQQLAVDRAIESKLHRSPEVLAQIEVARREILARAYMQKVAASLPKPTAEEIQQYYVENPQLFSERRIFNVQEIVVPVAADVAEKLRSFASVGKPIEAAAAWLKIKGIKFGSSSATRAAEQIPMELLAQIHTVKDGRSIVIAAPQTNTLLHVVSSQRSPVDEATALPRIEKFLSNQRAGEAVAANFKQLRANAKITYNEAFAQGESAALTAAQTSAADNPSKSSIKKGVAWLK